MFGAAGVTAVWGVQSAELKYQIMTIIKKFIKNSMFLPDCAPVVLFNYAIFIGILIIFSTNKPPVN